MKKVSAAAMSLCMWTRAMDVCPGCGERVWKEVVSLVEPARVGVMNPVHVDDCNGFFRCLTLMLPLTSMFENVLYRSLD